jgi:hypothetical protein
VKDIGHIGLLRPSWPTLHRKWVWQSYEPKQDPRNLIMDSDSPLKTVVGKWCSYPEIQVLRLRKQQMNLFSPIPCERYWTHRLTTAYSLLTELEEKKGYDQGRARKDKENLLKNRVSIHKILTERFLK